MKSVGSVAVSVGHYDPRKGLDIEVLTGAASNLTFPRAHLYNVSLSIAVFLCQFSFALSVSRPFCARRVSKHFEATSNEIADFLEDAS